MKKLLIDLNGFFDIIKMIVDQHYFFTQTGDFIKVA
jgi:hypothetical protein